jgi:hypothetical protein
MSDGENRISNIEQGMSNDEVFFSIISQLNACYKYRNQLVVFIDEGVKVKRFVRQFDSRFFVFGKSSAVRINQTAVSINRFSRSNVFQSFDIRYSLFPIPSGYSKIAPNSKI